MAKKTRPKKVIISPELEALLDREQERMFRERPPIKPALWMSEVTVSTVFGPNSESYEVQVGQAPA